MNKWQVIDRFWNSFGIPAYDENSVPDDAQMPYISYNAWAGNMDAIFNMTASIWYRSMSWKEISDKADDIAQSIMENGYKILPVDGGYLWMTLGRSPFAQRMNDPSDDMVKRMYLVMDAEFLTKY